jgi:hypothetical protein
MTDYDRGAYTPQTDAPLAFDPRRPSERRPMPMALIGSAAVMVILLAGVAMVYRGGVRHAGESPRPVGEPVMAVKTAPTAVQSAASAPSANMDVYSSGQGNTTGSAQVASAEITSNSVSTPSAIGPGPTAPRAASNAAPKFAPTAEQPAPRPAPKPATVAMLAKPTAPNHIERPPTPDEEGAKSVAAEAPKAPLKAAPASASLRPAPHSKIDEAELAAAGGTRLAEAEPAPRRAKADADADEPAGASAHKARAVETAAATPSASGKAAVVQIGAFSSSALADKGYADVSAALPGRMSGKAKHVQPLDKDGTTLYRTWLSGFASRADAQAFCEALKAKGKTCLVKG